MKYIILFLMFSSLNIKAQQIVFISNEQTTLKLLTVKSDSIVYFPKTAKNYVNINQGEYTIKFNNYKTAIVNLIVNRMGIELKPVTIEGIYISRPISILNGDKVIITYATKIK